HGSLEIHTEISISPEDDVEMRRIKLTNHSDAARTIEITTYAEVVLSSPAADAAHPAFGNLFVQTEFIREHPALLCTRRARAEGERPPWLLHLMTIQGAELGELSFETDRAKFLGRGQNLSAPLALQNISPLSNSAGSVLDPIVSLRRKITIAPESTAQIEIVMGVAENRETALALVEKYHNLRMADRLFDLAWTHSQVTLRHLGATEADAQFYGRMAGALVYADPLRRANASVLLSNRRGQSGLWSYGISGDSPIVLLRISDGGKMEIVRRLIQAHAYWRLKGLAVELVIVNEDASVYRQSLHDQILGLIAAGIEAQMLDKPGGIFVRRLEQIPPEDRVLLQSVARLVLSDENGTLEEQMQRRAVREPLVPEFKPARPRVNEVAAPLPRRELLYFNGFGGFTPDGHEYVITLQPGPSPQAQKRNASLLSLTPWRAEKPRFFNRASDPETMPGNTGHRAPQHSPPPRSDSRAQLSNQNTPAPWVNVLANPRFGTVVSESGGAYTWLENSHEFRLTPWNNDPVGDLSGEAFYLRDEETGEFWSPTPLPARGATPYVARHGFGYSVFEHIENGIASEMWIYVAMDAPVKFNLLKLRNLSGRPRRISVTGYWQWVLAEGRGGSSLHVHTETDPQSGALLARNRYHTEFAERVAFVDVNDSARTVTGDRREFVGRNATMANPAAMKKMRLSGKTGPGLDPCAAMQVIIDLPDQNEKEVSFRLGAGNNLQETQELIGRFRQPGSGQAALQGVWDYWNRTLGAVNIDTPDPATNVLVNGWLMYQTLSCRFWGRTGFYQSGGAYGFRDQLQDAMAFVHAEPRLLREHLLRAAAHQFRQGDVQHWWHPPANRGVRTHFSDDYLWLPYAVCRYVKCINDTGVLDEKIPFLEGRALKPEEESYYDLPTRSDESATLYGHCIRAIEYGLKFGEHGLPLMGCGDWNDGMNLVGEHGRGESVWLAFFLFDVLTQFAELAQRHQDPAFAGRCQAQAELLRQNIEKHAWDGQWYRRAYFDNGEPLGSKLNAECQIDALPQSWSVISGVGDTQRSLQAMHAVEQRLVRREAGLIQLFDPPFDKSPLNPGYIKGYLPGVRENGGQYTHGAIWTVMAFAQLGNNQLAWDLFSLLNPVNHARTPAQALTYKVEPYVVAADVYAVSPHVGRGGWTWYTGSAGWMYRLITETLLGLSLEGERLRLHPRMPPAWPGFKLHYRHQNTVYHFAINRDPAMPPGTLQITLDGQALSENAIPLNNDKPEHHVSIRLGDEIPGEKLSSENAPVSVPPGQAVIPSPVK
ncbi:MAG: Cellobiose phosphorylase, partial [Pedosphaera sp.]|nr:Cellobiose phosphorylase [Pedosphaera sp.]